MKYINPYGRSNVKKNAKKRTLTLKNGTEEKIAKFLHSEPEVIIAAFISVIDKIYRKPKKGAPTENLYELREALGNSCWSFVAKRIKTATGKEATKEHKKIWEWKLHPYSEKDSKKGNENKLKFAKAIENENVQGRWYKTFLSENPTKRDLEKAAKDIDAHLFENARRINGEKTQPKGMIAQRAEAIEKSLPLNCWEEIKLAWSDNDKQTYRAKFDPAKEIYELAKNAEEEKDKSKPKRIYASDAGKILFEGYKKIFADQNSKILTREEIKETDKKGLLALHEAIKIYYKRTLKYSKKGTRSRSKLSSHLPKNADELFNLIEKQHANRNVNRMIRFGRLLHYSGYRGGNFDYDKMDDLFAYYQTSEGQAEIKRSEAFVRIWRSSISQGARTLRALANVNDKTDVTSKNTLCKIKKNFNLHHAIHTSEKFKLLFGIAASKFPDPEKDEDKLRELLISAIKALSTCRHGVFHFSTRAKFVESLKAAVDSNKKDAPKTPDHVLETFKTVLNDDYNKRKKKRLENLEAVHLPYFANEEQIKAIWNELNIENNSDITLPKFHKLLAHIENVGQTDSFGKLKLPKKPNSEDLKDPATLCRYSVLKYLYEEPFRVYLENVSPSLISCCLDEIIERGEKRAKSANRTKLHQSFIKSKSAKLPRPNGKGIWEYFHALDGEIASLMRVQKGYESDKKAAKEKSNFIVNLQRELICSLFLSYLHDKGFGWLTKIKPDDKKAEIAAELPKAEKKEKDFELWEASLYFTFHLIPVDDLSLLLHQFRKWRVLSEKRTDKKNQQDALDDESKLRFLLSLCIEMHADKFDGTATNLGLDDVKILFEKEDDFNRIFGLDDVFLNSTKRGLREILRFGHFEALRQIFDQSKISASDVSKFLENEDKKNGELSPIALAQQERLKLHEKAVKSPRKFSSQDLKNYCKYTKTISNHRQLAAKVRLTNFTRAHSIMIRVLGRLIDFAATWERDQYFIFLAILQQEGISIEQITKLGEKNKRKKSIKDFKSAKINPFGLKQKYINKLEQYINSSSDDIRQIRNDLAHFNMLDRTAITINLTDQVNKVRKLMSYDRKLKNSVSKAIKELMQREGFGLTWQMNDQHQLYKAEIKTRKIKHLETVKRKLTAYVEPEEYIKKKNGTTEKKRVKDMFSDKKIREKITERITTDELANMVARLFDAK